MVQLPAQVLLQQRAHRAKKMFGLKSPVYKAGILAYTGEPGIGQNIVPGPQIPRFNNPAPQSRRPVAISQLSLNYLAGLL